MTLDEQYQKIIDDQRAYLLKLQEEFNKVCEEAKRVAQEKIKTIPKEDKEARDSILQEQKAVLDAALERLKLEVNQSTKDTMRELERIVRQKERKILAELEKELSAM